MKKLIIEKCCDKCNYQEVHNETVCDICGSNLDIYELGKHPPIKLRIDCTDYEFCNYTCLLQFIIGELKKQQPKENRDETQS